MTDHYESLTNINTIDHPNLSNIIFQTDTDTLIRVLNYWAEHPLENEKGVSGTMTQLWKSLLERLTDQHDSPTALPWMDWLHKSDGTGEVFSIPILHLAFASEAAQHGNAEVTQFVYDNVIVNGSQGPSEHHIWDRMVRLYADWLTANPNTPTEIIEACAPFTTPPPTLVGERKH